LRVLESRTASGKQWVGATGGFRRILAPVESRHGGKRITKARKDENTKTGDKDERAASSASLRFFVLSFFRHFVIEIQSAWRCLRERRYRAREGITACGFSNPGGLAGKQWVRATGGFRRIRAPVESRHGGKRITKARKDENSKTEEKDEIIVLTALTCFSCFRTFGLS